MVGIAGLQFPTSAADVVGIYTQNFKQVFPRARPLKVTVKPTAKLMEHPVETGATITDFRVIQPIEIELSLILQARDYKDTYQQIKDLYLKATLLTIQTRADVFKNQLIGEMPHEEDAQLYDVLKMVLKLKEVLFVTAKYGVVPRNPSNSSTVRRGGVQPKDKADPNNSVIKQVTDYFGRNNMIDVELAAIPNQSFSIRLSNRFYDITIKETKGTMCVDIIRDNVVVELGMRLVAGGPLIPYEYLEKDSGNFIILTQNEEYPYYTQFGITQFLVFVTPEELGVIRA